MLINTESLHQKVTYLLRKIYALNIRLNNLGILRIKNVKFSVYYFYMYVLPLLLLQQYQAVFVLSNELEILLSNNKHTLSNFHLILF